MAALARCPVCLALKAALGAGKLLALATLRRYDSSHFCLGQGFL
jgi:hypothetical protein